MSRTIDERVVSMAFENQKFEAGVAQTMATLAKLNAALANIGKTSGLAEIEAQSHKVTLAAPMSALDRLKAKLGLVSAGPEFAQLEGQSQKVTLAGPMSALDKLKAKLGFGADAAKGFGDIQGSSEKVTLHTPMAALDQMKAKLGTAGDTRAFADIQGASEKVTLNAPIKAMENVRASLAHAGDTSAFSEIEAASDKVSLAGLSSQLESLSSKFTALKATAVVAFANIATSAARSATAAVKNFTLGPIKDGMEEYGLKLNAVQTIMAATGKGSKPVIAALDELNRYSDRTIYSFKDMIQNIPKFANAGVALEPSVKAIQGISQVAAVSGASAEEAARAMFNFSQAMGSGFVALRDWRSIDLANMGTIQFKQQLIDTGVAMGTLKKQGDGTFKTLKGTTVTAKNFTDGLKDQWLTTNVLTDTLAKYTDENTKLGKQAFASATDIKTLTQLMGVFRESIGSGWGKTWELIFGNLDQAKSLWRGVNEEIGGFITRSADARNKVLGDWQKLGGRTAAIEAIKNIWTSLKEVLGSVHDAFRDIFPRKTGQDLADATKRFAEFTKSLVPSKETVKDLRDTFKGFFAILDIGWYIIKKVAGVLFDLLGIAGKGSGGILKFTGSVGQFLSSLDKAIVKGDALNGFFQGITNVLRVPLELIRALASAFFSLFDGMDVKKADSAGKAIDGVGASLKPFKRIVDGVRSAWQKFVDLFDKVKDVLSPVFDRIGTALSGFGQILGDAFEKMDFERVFKVVEVGLIGGIFAAVRKGLGIQGNTVNFNIGTLGKLNELFKGLTGNLTAMQKNIQANTLLQIALAIGVLAGGVLILSTIDPKKLTSAMSAVAVGLGQLVAAMAILSKVAGGFAGAAALPFIAAGLIGLAGAVVILAGALKIFATMSWEEIGRGLTGMAGTLATVGTALHFIDPAGMIRIGVGLTAMAGALVILGIAMKIMADMSWEEMAQGLTGIGGSLAVLAGAMQIMNPAGMIRIGLGIGAIAFGLTLMAGAVSAFGNQDLETLGKGMAAIGVALVGLGYAVDLIPPGMAAKAGGLILLAIALNGVASAVKTMGGLKVEDIIKGLSGLGGALAIMVVALNLMQGTLAGSAALLIAAGALAILAPTLGFLGTLKWETIGKGLLAIAATLTVLGIAGALGAEAIGALGLALLPFGLALLAAGGGAYFLAKALGILGKEGTKGVAAMVVAFTAFLALLPTIITKFASGLVQLLADIASLAPSIVTSMGTIIQSLLQVVIEAAPRMATAAGVLILSFLKVLNDNSPALIQAGWNLFLNLLSGLESHVGEVVTHVAHIVATYLSALASHAGEIIDAGALLLIRYMQGIVRNLPALVSNAARMIRTWLTEVGKHIGEVIDAGSRLMAKFVLGAGRHVTRLASAGITAIIQFLDAIGKRIPDIIDAGRRLAKRFLDGVASGLVRITRDAADALIRFMNGFAQAIRDKGPELRRAGWNIADAIIDGILDGFKELWHKVEDKMRGMMESLKHAATHPWEILSPSKYAKNVIAGNIIAGLVSGLEAGSKGTRSPNGIMQAIMNSVKDAADTQIAPIEPVITPVVDTSKVEEAVPHLMDLFHGPRGANGVEMPVGPGDMAMVNGRMMSAFQATMIDREMDRQRALQAASQTHADAAAQVTFNQTNTSPEALSETEIYRQTRNGLSQLRGSLGLSLGGTVVARRR